MKKFAFIAPMFVLGFLTYWGFAWFCSEWRLSNGPIRTLVGIIDAIGEPAFCNLAIFGSVGFPIYIVVYSVVLRKKLQLGGISEETSRDLSGIRGWLLLPAIGLVLFPIGLLRSMAQVYSIGMLYWGDMIDKPAFRYLREHDQFMVVCEVILLLFCVFSALRFFCRKRAAPRLMIALMIASLLYFIVKIIVFASCGPNYDVHVPAMIVSLVVRIILVSVGIAYFRRSRRVKATFVL